MANAKTMGPAEIKAALAQLAAAIAERHRGGKTLLLLGVANGGVELARRLGLALAAAPYRLSVKVGTIDISFLRDDIGRNPIP